MAIRYKIKTSENNHVHFYGLGNDYSLCGLESSGDESIGIMPAKLTTQKVNCPDCIQIVNYCQTIKKSEFKTK